MATNTFDKSIKNKLEERQLQPSTAAWNTLSKRLENQEQKQSKKGFWWLGIAASMVGVLLLINIVITSNKNTTTNTNITNAKDATDSLIIIRKSLPIMSKPQTKLTNINKVPAFKKTRTITNKKAAIAQSKLQKINIKQASTLPSSLTVNPKNTIVQVTSKIEVNKSTVVKKPLAIDTEVNALLAEANKSITLQKTNKKRVPVDYNGLLLAVEDDLDQSFRHKIFNVIKEGYSTVKASVAQRNY